jgi:hypothetical protein
MRPRRSLLCLLLACGPAAPMDATGDDSSSTAPDATTAAPPSTLPPPGDPTTTGATTTAATSSSTTAVDPSTGTSTGSSSDDTLGLTFLVSSDGGSGCLTARGARSTLCSQCDIWAQDCPPDTKCSPHDANDDGEVDAVKCVPIVAEPDHPGEPCTVEGDPLSGIDSCDLDSICLDVDPDTLTGTCVRGCDGVPEQPSCPVDTTCRVTNDGALAVCLPACDPLLQDCAADHACGPNPGADDFLCAADASGDEGQAFDPCASQGACDPGLVCVAPAAAVECDPAAIGCCVPFCDLSLPPGQPGAGQTCVSWYDPEPPPPEFADVGRCTAAP